MRTAKWRLALLLIPLAFLARPLPANAEITVGATADLRQSSAGLLPTDENKDLFWQAVHFLANAPELKNHPIRRYLNDPDISAHVWFDDSSLYPSGVLAYAEQNKTYIKPDEDMAYYIGSLAHEFIHIDLARKYVSSSSGYSFLHPEDFAFRHLMEEAFANTLGAWLRLAYPQEMNSDFQIRDWRVVPTSNDVTDAMRNDLRSEHPDYDDEQITNIITRNILTNFMMGWYVAYSMDGIPQEMKTSYGEGNTFLIPEYAAYRERGDALLRHQWDYLISIMPFTLSDDMTYDYFRGQFKDNYTLWAEFSNEYSGPDADTVLGWINYDYEEAARERIARQNPEDISYAHLSSEDEANLNHIFQEIDPTFTPVNTRAASSPSIVPEIRDGFHPSPFRR